MSVNKKIIESILPVLQNALVGMRIAATTDSVFTGKFKIPGTKGHLLIQDKDNFEIKIFSTRHNFIIIDLDDTAFPAEDYVKEQWKQKVLVLRVGNDGRLKYICVAPKVGEMTPGDYFVQYFPVDICRNMGA